MPYVDKQKQRDYQKSYHKKWHQKNGISRRLQIKQRKETIRLKLLEHKATKCCAKCKEADSRCLEFHHTDKTQKEFNISNAVKNGLGWERILREISKCVVLCANCHRKLHEGNTI